jgi:hypothetical protein
MLTLGRAAYELVNDGTLSGDEYGFQTSPENHHCGSIPVPRQQEGSEFHPTLEDITLVRYILPLPAELVTAILDRAGYWFYSRATRSDLCQFYHANKRYLQSEPIQGGDFTYPLRHLVITTHSKDQGWSSYPKDHGTRGNSWTWFELTFDDGATDDAIVRVEVMRNIHAGSEFEIRRTVIEDETILKQAKKGDRLSVWARAAFSGWCNQVLSVEIETSVAC